MSRPQSPTEYGTTVANVDPTLLKHARHRHRRSDRFKNIEAYLDGTMPTVSVGDVYTDLDPRNKGRLVQILAVTPTDRVLIRTIVESKLPPKTAARTRRIRTGTMTTVSLRRFTENTRGYRYLYSQPIRTTQALTLAATIATAANIPVTDREIKVADALIGLLTHTGAHHYINLLIKCEALTDVYDGHKPLTSILRDAACHAEEQNDYWTDTPVVLDRAAARTLATTL